MSTQITVLVIDDNEAIITYLRTLLELRGHRVFTALNGRQGLEVFEREIPDIVLVDLHMPGMSGLTFIAEIRKTVYDLPIIVISGQGTLADAIKVTRYGAWDYIAKPINQEELDFSISNCLERARLLRENCNYRELLEQLVHAQASEIKESEERYQRLLESVTNYVYTIIVRNGVPTEIIHRQGCERITGYSLDEFNADPGLWYRIVHEDDRPLVYAMAQQMLIEPDNHTLEHRIIHKDGAIRWVSNTLVPSPSWRIPRSPNDVTPDSTCPYYDGIITDITRCKTAEEQLRLGLPT